jgi:polyisoprenoid-binding protein YceI
MVQAEVWSVIPGSSRLGFVGSQGGQPFEGRFERFAAEIAFDPERPGEGKVLVTIEMASATTGNRDRDGALPTPDWFHVGAHPQGRFETTAIRALGDGRYEASAKLTIRGVTKDVLLPFTLAITGDDAAVKGELTIDRTAFGVGQGPWASGQMVGLPVKVVVDIAARRQRPHGAK